MCGCEALDSLSEVILGFDHETVDEIFDWRKRRNAITVAPYLRSSRLSLVVSILWDLYVFSQYNLSKCGQLILLQATRAIIGRSDRLGRDP